MDSYADSSDEDLLEAFYRGDDQAFEDFDRRYRAALIGLAFLLLRTHRHARREEAEDVAQETLAKVAATKGKPSSRWNRSRGPVRPWVLRILHNTVVNHLRRRNREPVVFSDCASAGTGEAEEGMQEAVPAGDPGPVELLEQVQLLEALEQCVQQLPDELMQIVRMLFEQGLSQTEIAGVMGRSIPTVNRRLWNTAIPLLRECLQSKGVLEDWM